MIVHLSILPVMIRSQSRAEPSISTQDNRKTQDTECPVGGCKILTLDLNVVVTVIMSTGDER